MKFTDLLAPLPADANDWNDDGVVIHQGLLRDADGLRQMAEYETEWLQINGPLPPLSRRAGGWPDATPYVRYPALRRLVCNRQIALALQGLIGEPAGVHLNLTGWVSTTRNWHQDTYLNPPEVGDAYAAVWIALENIRAESGPFQYVPGSHKWGQVTRAKMWEAMGCDGTDPMWPRQSEEILTPMIEEELGRRGARIVTYIPKRGDVLIWHGRLLHRGSRGMSGTYRKALIAHYSGIHHRPDMPDAVQHEEGGWYFPLTTSVPVR